MSDTQNWTEYNKRVSKEPRELLVKSMDYVSAKNRALDLGAGNLRDTVYLLKNGFAYVDVVDIQPELNQFVQELDSLRVHAFITSFEKFEYTKKYDLITAQYALPFMRPDIFYSTFTTIKNSLAHSGIITGQFFGKNDSWNHKIDMTFFDLSEAKKLLNDLDICYFLEEEKDGVTALGESKHWHVFHFIAKLKKK